MLRQVVSCWRLWYDHSFWAGGNNSVVECDLAKVEVAGSNPVSRSISHIGGAPCTPPGGLHYAPSSRFDFADHALSTVDGRCSLRSGRSCLDVVSAFAFQLTPRAPSPAEGGRFPHPGHSQVTPNSLTTAASRGSVVHSSRRPPSADGTMCRSSQPIPPDPVASSSLPAACRRWCG